MPQMQFGLSSYQRARGDLPALPVINMFAEASPVEEKGVILQSRPGLDDRAASIGNDIEMLFTKDGVLNGDLFGVSGGFLYRSTSFVGEVPGDGPVSIAGNEIGVMATAGEDLKFYNGALSTVSFPDGADVSKVFSGGARFWAIRADTGRVYWTPALGSAVDPLDFATAESLPDRLLDALWIDDTAVLFGSESVEFWPNTGDADLPIQPLEGRVFEKGVKATGCATAFDASFAWVTNDNSVCVNGQKPEPISQPGMNERIAASESCRLFTFLFDGQEFLCLRLDFAEGPGETHAFGAESRMWNELASYGETNWLPKTWAGGVFGCSNGRTAQWSAGWEDFGGVLERRLRGGFPINGGGVTISNLLLRCNTGQTPFLTGVYADPLVEMRLSDDAGRTWYEWEGVNLGTQGAFGDDVAWHNLGMASYPGMLAEFRISDPVDFRVSDMLLNEPYGGR